MLRSFLLIVFVFIGSLQLSAQENTKKKLKIKAAEESNKNNFSLFPKKTTTSDFKILNKKNTDGLVDPRLEYLNPGVDFKPKISGKERKNKINPKYYSDQDLGTFYNNGDFIRFICRDHQDEDGDRVKILLNGKVIVPNILLLNRAKNLNIPLQKGFNKIDVIALNQGLGGPNTAEFRVYDDNGILVSKNIWNLATGVKASMIIVKE